MAESLRTSLQKGCNLGNGVGESRFKGSRQVECIVVFDWSGLLSYFSKYSNPKRIPCLEVDSLRSLSSLIGGQAVNKGTNSLGLPVITTCTIKGLQWTRRGDIENQRSEKLHERGDLHSKLGRVSRLVF